MASVVPLTKSDTTASMGAPQPSIMMPVWPVATNAALSPARRAASRSSSITDILPMAQSVPTARSTLRPGQVRAPHRGDLGSGRPPHVVDGHAGRLGSGRAAPGRPRGTCAGPEMMSRPASMDRSSVRRQASGSRPPVGAMPMSSASGGSRERERLVDRGDDGHVRPTRDAPEIAHPAGRPRGVDDRDHRPVAVAQDAERGLAVMRVASDSSARITRRCFAVPRPDGTAPGPLTRPLAGREVDGGDEARFDAEGRVQVLAGSARVG